MAVQDLTKEYRIYSRPVDRLLEAVFRRPRHRTMQAVRGVSFAIQKGECLGIIGNNGAGKSTLLKLLVGTVSPTSGSIRMEGRTAALLELGAGFHPEFTGRQNIFLNGSLMGISEEEIGRRESEIIEFSELEDFIDQPVKTYSSGMYVRLAFGIATSVQSEILVIDEALSVGDLSFQRKCIDRMAGFRKEGKTMIFCSHSMYHIHELCDSVIWMDRGTSVKRGPTEEVVPEYEEYCRKKDRVREVKESEAPRAQAKDCAITGLCIETPDGQQVDNMEPLSEVALRMNVEILKDNVFPQFGFALVTQDGSVFSATSTHSDRVKCGPYHSGQKIIVRMLIQDIPLKGGSYKLTAGVSEENALLWYESKSIWPVLVKGEKGIGQVTFRRTWDIRCVD
ncbi:MAG: ABC transporter ATP-binding protein [Deltaproteobacteria bacterium]|nr:ABC transporter ATP-binding protein [Deltaproteobacteria bacterium]